MISVEQKRVLICGSLTTTSQMEGYIKWAISQLLHRGDQLITYAHRGVCEMAMEYADRNHVPYTVYGLSNSPSIHVPPECYVCVEGTFITTLDKAVMKLADSIVVVGNSNEDYVYMRLAKAQEACPGVWVDEKGVVQKRWVIEK